MIRRNPSLFIGAASVTVLVIVATCGPVVTRADPLAIDLARALAPPSRSHWLGCDSLGRDLLARIVGPMFAATLFDKHPALPYLICAVLSLFTGLIAWQFLHRSNQSVVAAKTQEAG